MAQVKTNLNALSTGQRGNDDDCRESRIIKIYTGKENSISKNNNNQKIDSEQQ